MTIKRQTIFYVYVKVQKGFPLQSVLARAYLQVVNVQSSCAKPQYTAVSPPRVIPNREDTIYTIYLSTVFTCPGPAINGGWWLPAGSGAQITHFQTPFYVISRGWSPVLHCSAILRHSTIQSVHCLDTLDTEDTSGLQFWHCWDTCPKTSTMYQQMKREVRRQCLNMS